MLADGRAAREQAASARASGERQPYWWTERSYSWPRWHGFDARFSGYCSPDATHDALTVAFFELVNALALPAPEGTPLDSGVEEPERRYQSGGRWVTPVRPWARVVSHSKGGDAHHEWGFKRLVLLRPEVRDLLDGLHLAIGRALEAVYAAGRDRGASILRGLASGETSVHEFNEATSGEGRRR